MTVTAEQVARALRSWELPRSGGTDLVEALQAVCYRPHEAIESLARHVAAVLSSEPVRIEVQQTGASGSLTRIWCDS